MNHYLADIAARNAGYDRQYLNPAGPEPTAFDEQSAAEGHDNFQQNEFIQQNLLPDSPNQIQSTKSSGMNNEIEIPLYKQNNTTSYFSKHTERQNNIEVGSALPNNLLETNAFKSEQSSEKIKAVPEQINFNENEIPLIDNTGSITFPEKKVRKERTVNKTNVKSNKPDELNEVEEVVIEHKQLISPLAEVTKKTDKLISNKIGVERIVPNLEGNENKRHIQNKKQQTNPKLVIGKITVEILPPIATGPPKIITRVVSPSSKPTSSKSNKLIFGLGQL